MTEDEILDKKLKRYYRRIKRILLCPGKEKKKFLDDLKNSIEDFKSEYSKASFEDIQKQFGDPKSISETFAAETDIETIRKQKEFKIIRVIILSILIAIAAFAIGLSVYILVTNNPGQYYEEAIDDFGITEIIEE